MYQLWWQTVNHQYECSILNYQRLLPTVQNESRLRGTIPSSVPFAKSVPGLLQVFISLDFQVLICPNKCKPALAYPHLSLSEHPLLALHTSFITFCLQFVPSSHFAQYIHQSLGFHILFLNGQFQLLGINNILCSIQSYTGHKLSTYSGIYGDTSLVLFIPKKNQSNTTLILKSKSEVATCFGLSRGHLQAIR
jgi:hypothetical protein